MMAKGNLLSPGQMVISKEKNERLFLWSSYRGEIDETCGLIEIDELLLVLESKESDDKQESLTPEWENGAYYVMASNGLKGWIGSGWVEPITKDKI